MTQSILAGQDRISLENGFDLRLLSALEVLQARREAAELTGEDRERALCSNACLLARALERSEDRRPVFDSGRAVLAGLTVEEIAALAGRWSMFSRESGPGLDLSREELEGVKRDLSGDPGERLRWRVLRQFHALPSEGRARSMKERDYLWCLANTLLDREETLGRLCPSCRTGALEERCPVCGKAEAEWGEGADNAAFDPGRFEKLRGGGGAD